MRCFECDQQLEKGVTKCPNCGTEYGDLSSALASIHKKQEETQAAVEAPKRGRGRPRKTDVTVTITPAKVTSTNTLTNEYTRNSPLDNGDGHEYTIPPALPLKPSKAKPPTVNTDKVFPWNRYDSRFPSVIAPAQFAGKPFCPATPKKVEGGYSTKEEDVMAWVEEVVLIGHQERKMNYTLTAILYFAAKFWQEFPTGQIAMESDSEYVTVKKLLIGAFLEGKR